MWNCRGPIFHCDFSARSHDIVPHRPRVQIAKHRATHKLLITIEEGAAGGFGAHVLTLLAEAGALESGLKVRTMTLPDKFQDHDKPERMYAAAGLDAKGIVAKAIAALGDVERLASSRSA